MNKILVARKPCGCVTAAALDDNYAELGNDVLEWLRRGDIVSYEIRDKIGFERCDKHKEIHKD